jgi:hypothetical protein
MQDAIAILIVAIAAVFLARRGWQRFARRQGGACGSCPSCSSSEALQSKPLVTITPIVSHAKAERREGKSFEPRRHEDTKMI